MANSIFMWPGGISVGAGGMSIPSGQYLAPDGTAALPSFAFTSQPNTGIFHAAVNDISFSNNGNRIHSFSTTGYAILSVNPIISLGASLDVVLRRAAAGQFSINNTGLAIGSLIKVDALPTIASGFGTSPSITAGSTPLSGSVDVGTGGVATSGVINFNGTAFPSAPFVVVTSKLTNAVIRAVASATQLTITCTTAFTASDVISWVCISSK